MPRLLQTGFVFSLLWFFSSSSVVFAQAIINEFLPAPGSGSLEWVEIFNPSSESADLSDYFFDDDKDFLSDSGSSIKIALSGILTSQTVCYWELTGYLNNNGDIPTLFLGDGTVADSFPYSSSKTDKSYGRIPDGGVWQANISPTKPGIKCQSLLPEPLEDTPVISTPSPTITLHPKVNFIVGNRYELGTSFGMNLKLEEFEADTVYFLKVRAGVSETALSKGQTKRGDAFYADSESWPNFPQVKTDSSGKWVGEITGRVGEDKPAGDYFVRVRVRKKDADSFFDSELKTVAFLTPVVTPAQDSQQSAVSNEVEPDDTKDSTSLSDLDTIHFAILGTESAVEYISNTQSSPEATVFESQNPEKKDFFLAISGSVILSVSIITLLIRKLKAGQV